MAQPNVGKQGDQVMDEEQQQTDAGQKNSYSFQIGPEHRELDLRKEETDSGL